MGRLRLESEQSEVAHDLARKLRGIRGSDTTARFAERFISGPVDAALRRTVGAICQPQTPSTVIESLRSEADRVAVTLVAWPDEGRPVSIQKGLFNALFVLWRFGSLPSGEAALKASEPLVGNQDCNQAQLRLRRGLLLERSDPVAAGAEIAHARRLGAPVPRAVEHLVPVERSRDVGSLFKQKVSTRQVCAPSTRRFPLARGDGWHPVFDMAARQLPALNAFVIENGTLSLRRSASGVEQYVFDADGALIPELSVGTQPFMADASHRHQSLVLLEDWHSSFNHSLSSFNLSHAIFDNVTRLEAYRGVLNDPQIVAVLYSEQPYYRHLFAALGQDWISPQTQEWTVRADQLALLSNHFRGTIMHPAFSGAPYAADFITQRLRAQTLGHRRIYISREDAAIRRNLNEEDVRGVFETHGFECHRLADLPFSEQRTLMAQASHVAGLHGAGLTNMVFTGPGARLMELMPPNNGSFAYWVMASALGISYRLLTVEDAWLDTGSAATVDLALNFRDCRVDIDRLDAALTEFIKD